MQMPLMVGAASASRSRPGTVGEAGTEGGEALLEAAMRECDPRWHVLWTRSHCEPLVRDQLAGKGFHLFLPEMDAWSRRNGTRHLIRVPMFPGYLFLRHAMGKQAYLEVRQARGLVAILGERWDRLAEVPDREIDAIQSLSRSHLPALPHPYLKEGQRVRIARGPLAGAEGFLVRSRADKGLLVLSVDLLQRSVAVEIDCTSVVA